MQIKILFSVAAIVALSSFGARAQAHDQNEGNFFASSFASSVVGSTPGVTVAGVASGDVPWTVKAAVANVSPRGQILVKLVGLLIAAASGVPANLVGTVGPVNEVAASLVCGGSGGTVAASTGGFPLAAGGNATIFANVTLPAQCQAPIVLVRIFSPAAAANAQLGAFIALTGFNQITTPGNSDGNENSAQD
jgi:hypothetical protein